jgi:hypothetical protein
MAVRVKSFLHGPGLSISIEAVAAGLRSFRQLKTPRCGKYCRKNNQEWLVEMSKSGESHFEAKN